MISTFQTGVRWTFDRSNRVPTQLTTVKVHVVLNGCHAVRATVHKPELTQAPLNAVKAWLWLSHARLYLHMQARFGVHGML